MDRSYIDVDRWVKASLVGEDIFKGRVGAIIYKQDLYRLKSPGAAIAGRV